MPELLSLPQPSSLNRNDSGTNNRPYKYITHDQLEVDWLGSSSTLQKYLNESTHDVTNHDGRYRPGTLVWVLQSKGRQHSRHNVKSECTSHMIHKKRRDKKDARGATNRNSEKGGVDASTIDEHAAEEMDTKLEESTGSSYAYHSRSEWYLRARVVWDEDPLEGGMSLEQRMQRRVKVRYSKGSTYRVRAFNLVPVIEQRMQIQQPYDECTILPPIVIVTPETNIYRRIAKAHTTPNDSFMEIGCDYGITVDKIRKAMVDAGDVPLTWPPIETDDNAQKDKEASCLGIDRSQESIGIANERFPQCKFRLCNVLKTDDMMSLNKFCLQNLKGGAPSVIAIDINGNRDVDGVLECLQIVMNEDWVRQPRLIVVKSRFLYWDMRKMRK